MVEREEGVRLRLKEKRTETRQRQLFVRMKTQATHSSQFSGDGLKAAISVFFRLHRAQVENSYFR